MIVFNYHEIYLYTCQFYIYLLSHGLYFYFFWKHMFPKNVVFTTMKYIYILVHCSYICSTIFMELLFSFFFTKHDVLKMIVLAVSTIKYMYILVTALTYIHLFSLDYSFFFFLLFFGNTGLIQRVSHQLILKKDIQH